MKSIWKYPLELIDVQLIGMPKDAEILAAQMQNGVACLWALVTPDAPKHLRAIEIHGTGNPFDEHVGVSRKFIATFQQPPFVWHVFERINVHG